MNDYITIKFKSGEEERLDRETNIILTSPNGTKYSFKSENFSVSDDGILNQIKGNKVIKENKKKAIILCISSLSDIFRNDIRIAKEICRKEGIENIVFVGINKDTKITNSLLKLIDTCSDMFIISMNDTVAIEIINYASSKDVKIRSFYPRNLNNFNKGVVIKLEKW